MKLSWATFVLFWGAACGCLGQVPTMLDTAFIAGGGANDDVFAIAGDTDGRLLVAGQFTTFGILPRGRLVRLQSGGGIDPGYFNGEGANNSIYTVAVQPDGKVLIGGSFTRVHGQVRTYLARLDASGGLDPDFAAVPVDNELRSIAVEPDGRILIAGRFTQVHGQTRRRIARLTVGGAIDTSFNPGTGASDNIRTMLRLADGRILIGGQFTTFNGTNRSRIARLEADGSLDLSFDPGLGADGQVRAIATNRAGLIYIGGDFASFNGTNRLGMARLFSQGGLDRGFNPTNSSGAAVRGIAVQPDGMVWMGGSFSFAGGADRANIARLHDNGSADEFFRPFASANNEVFAIAFDIDGVVIGGDFTGVDNFARARVARLLLNATGVFINFAGPSEEVPENAGVTTVRLERFGTVAGSASVAVRTKSGTALAGEDYTAYSATVTIPDGQWTATASIVLRDDPYPEGTEWFEVELINPSGSGNPIRQVSIIDNEFQAGVDETFKPDSINGPVFAAAAQPDGKVVIGGAFTYRGSCLENYLSRLGPDGMVDCDFYLHSVGANGPVHTVSLQTNGFIVAGGAFTYFNSSPARHLARVRPEGFSDTNFQAGTNLDGIVLATAIQADARILVGGMFTNFGANLRTHLARLHADGTLDDSFNPALLPGGFVRAIRLTGGGRILIAGDFTGVNGSPRSRVARLNPDGSLDPDFDPGAGPDGSVRALAELPDGRIVIAGGFSRVGGQPRARIALLEADGTLDSTFDVGSLGDGPRVNAVAVQQDGKILLGGSFTHIGTKRRPNFGRVHGNGVIDDTYFPSSGANGEVHSVQVLPGGKILAAGAFTEIGGTPRLYIARLEPETAISRIELASSSLSVSEAIGAATVAVRRVGHSDRTVAVNFSTAADTAQPGMDFAPQSGTLTFAPLETEKVISLPILNDGLPESAERFRVRLSDPAGGASLGNRVEATITVNDNDRGTDVAQSIITVREGAPQVEIAIRRNSDGPGNASVDFMTVNGSALAGIDYLATNGTLTFLPGETGKIAAVTLLNDPAFEGRESFRLILSNPSAGTTLGQVGEATVFIEDQDSSFAFASVNSAVENVWNAPVYVQRRGLMTLSASVRVRSGGGTATPGLDYIPVDRVLDFAPGESIQHFYVTNLNDGLVEPTESVRFTLSEPTALSIVEEPAQAFSEIHDNDRGIEFIAPLFHANEFSASARVIVRRGDDGTDALTVQFHTANEDAIAGADYATRSGTLTLVPGETNAAIFIPILPDPGLETNESFTVALSQPGPSASLGTQTVARVVILDDERAGSLDVGFLANPDDISPWRQYSAPINLSADPAGRLLVGAVVGLARLGRDGSNDTNFAPNPYYFFTPVTLTRPDGTILVGGSSSNDFAGAGIRCLRLLTTNGLEIPSFQFPISQGRTAAIAMQDDGRILIGGNFASGGNLLRVLPTGELDPGFSLATFNHFEPFFIGPSTVEAVAVQPDGKILAAGRFSKVDGQARDNIVRFTRSGSVDPAFQGPAALPLPVDEETPFGTSPSHYVAMVLQPDGRIFVAGGFTNLGSLTANNLARLNPDGSLDTTFVSPLAPAQTVSAIALQPDGRLLVAIGRYSYSASDIASFLLRLLPDGTFDPSFDAGGPPNGSITDLVLLPGGDIAVGGSFTEMNGIRRPLVARLRGDGLMLAARPPGPGTIAIDVFNTWPGGVTVLEASDDLLRWEPLRTNVATEASQRFSPPPEGPHLFYRARHTAP